MAICEKCKNQIPDDAAGCPVCDAATEPAAQNDFVAKVQELNNTADTTAQFDRNDIEKNKILALFSYIGILFLVPLLAAKDSAYARFHANQGIVLFIAELVLGIALNIVSAILLFIVPLLSVILGIINWLIGVLFLMFAILGIVNAVTGKAKELPLIGGIKILK